MENKQLIQKSLKWSVADGIFWALMMGLGESFILPLGVYFKIPDQLLAFCYSVPLLGGAILQIFSASMLRFFGSRKKMVSSLSFLQAICYLFLLTMLSLEKVTFLFFFMTTFIYWASALCLGPVWSSWIGSLTENVPRNTYFAKRNQWINLAMMCSMLMAGYFMKQCEIHENQKLGFMFLFSCAFLFRSLSTWCLTQKYDPPTENIASVSLKQFYLMGFQLLRRKELVIFGFMAAFNFGVFFSAAFFVPYMFKDLKLSFDEFMLIQASSIAAKVLFLKPWGVVCEKYGSRKVIILCAFFIFIIPLLWFFYFGVWYLCFVQIFTGIIWAGFELSSFNLMLGSSPEKERTVIWAWYNCVNGLGQVIASLTAGYFITYGLFHYHDVFLISGILRLIAVLLFAKFIFEIQDKVESIKYYQLFIRILGERLNYAVIFARRKKDQKPPL